MLGQPLVGRVALEEEGGVGQSVRQATPRRGPTLLTDLACCKAVTQVQSSPEQLSHPTRKANGFSRCGRRHLVGTPQ
jgi:hypothetical protein